MARAIDPGSELVRIPVRMIAALSEGEACIVGPCTPNQVSSEFTRLGGKFTQRRVLVVEPKSAECQGMFLVQRLRLKKSGDSKK